MAKTVALSLKDAEAFLKAHDRHYAAPAEAVCAIGLEDDGALHGAAILGRDSRGYGVLAHIYVDGTWQGYSLLYGACWRAFHALGYEHISL